MHHGILTAGDSEKYVNFVFDPTAATSKTYVFDPSSVTWTEFSTSGSPPSPRSGFGSTATPDGKIYVFGGADATQG
jgi:N-acetylneuraminic acid mutarotase